jgi:CTP:molybdopterin cytidylyltransferase MocA
VDTYRKLGIAFKKNPHQIIKPSCGGKTGHPVIVPRRLAEKVPPEDLEGGLQAFLTRSAIEVYSIHVEDEGILQNMNGPA